MKTSKTKHVSPGESVTLTSDLDHFKVALYAEPTLISDAMKTLPHPEGYISKKDVGIVLETRESLNSTFVKVLVGSAVGWVEIGLLEVC